MNVDEFVLDCSATVPWLFSSEATSATERLLDALTAGAKAWVPALWHLEIGNVLLGAERRGRVDKAGIESFFSSLAVYDIEVDNETIALAWTKTFSLGEAFGLTMYDAAYLEIALRRGIPLASLDEQLRVAMRKAGVRVLL
jgi:predicted nucleic acid-binding protein